MSVPDIDVYSEVFLKLHSNFPRLREPRIWKAPILANAPVLPLQSVSEISRARDRQDAPLHGGGHDHRAGNRPTGLFLNLIVNGYFEKQLAQSGQREGASAQMNRIVKKPRQLGGGRLFRISQFWDL